MVTLLSLTLLEVALDQAPKPLAAAQALVQKQREAGLDLDLFPSLETI